MHPGVLTPTISVVLAVYNGERHLERSLRSVLDQTFADFELIVVDDGSTDRTPGIIAQVAALDSRVVPLRQDNQGLTASLTRGVALATGEYVARQDADDLSMPDRFERQLTYLQRHPSIAALGTAADVIDADGTVIGAMPALQGAAVRHGLLTLRGTPVHGSMMIRRTALEEVGGYRAAFPVCQDYDLWLRMVDRFELENLSEVLYQWRMDTGSTYTSRRATQLRYTGIARLFADERAAHASDSYDALRECAGDLRRFASGYRMRGRLHALWGELLLRGLGNSAGVRHELRQAVRGACLRPWVLLLLVWTHFGLPWPGGQPLTMSGAGAARS